MRKLLLVAIIFFIYTSQAYASDVSIDAPRNVSDRGQFNVFVNLNTGGASINSIDISISYPKDILVFKGYKEDGSIKKLWLMQPKDTDGIIHFSGIIPGGVEGVYNPDKDGLQPIPLVQLLFSPNGNGEGVFMITHSDILKNDGLGTRLDHEDINSPITISMTESTLSATDNYSDKIPPEPFTIQYIPSGFFSKTPGMISFFTTDIDGGIEKYQLKSYGDSWKDVLSPLATPKGIIKREVVVRAVDFSGNSREASVEIPGILSPLQLLGIFIFCLTCYFTFFVVKRKR